MSSRVEMRQLTSMTQGNMSMISWQIIVVAAVYTFELSGAELARYRRLTLSSFQRTRNLSTSDVTVLYIFFLCWVSWWGVYLLFLQLQKLWSACFPQRVMWCPEVREWEAVKKMCLECFFLESIKKSVFNVYSWSFILLLYPPSESFWFRLSL